MLEEIFLMEASSIFPSARSNRTDGVHTEYDIVSLGLKRDSVASYLITIMARMTISNLDEIEQQYSFVSVEQLYDDFTAAVRNLGGLI